MRVVEFDHQPHHNKGVGLRNSAGTNLFVAAGQYSGSTDLFFHTLLAKYSIRNGVSCAINITCKNMFHKRP